MSATPSEPAYTPCHKCSKDVLFGTSVWNNTYCEECFKTLTVDMEQCGKELGIMLDEKNIAYGDSFGTTGAFIKLLYPNGVPVDQYDNVQAFVQMFNKMKRIATLENAFHEDPKKDLAGYAVLFYFQFLKQRETQR